MGTLSKEITLSELFCFLPNRGLLKEVRVFSPSKQITVDSSYLEVPGTLWKPSRYSYLDIPDLKNWGKNKSNNHILQMNMYWLLKFRIYGKYCGNFSSFSIIFCYTLLDFHVKTGTRFSLRDKRLFEKSKVQITRVDCISFRVDPLSEGACCAEKQMEVSLWKWQKNLQMYSVPIRLTAILYVHWRYMKAILYKDR